MTTESLVLPEATLEPHEVRIGVHDSGLVTESSPNSPSAELTSTLLSSVIGIVRLPSNLVHGDLVVTVEGRTKSMRDPNRFREIHVARVSGMPNVDTVDYGWAAESLPPGEYAVTYAGQSVQGVTLEPGLNEVFASFSGKFDLQILCVNAANGSPISASTLFWANLYGDQPTGTFSGHLDPQHGLVGVGEAVTLEGIVSDQIVVYVRALGFAPTRERLYLSDGPVQVVEMSPIFHLVIKQLDTTGTPITRFPDPFLGKEIKLIVGESVYSPLASGMNKEGMYADYDGLEKDHKKWTLLLPDGFQIQEVGSGPIGPGRTLQVTLQPSV